MFHSRNNRAGDCESHAHDDRCALNRESVATNAPQLQKQDAALEGFDAALQAILLAAGAANYSKRRYLLTPKLIPKP